MIGSEGLSGSELPNTPPETSLLMGGNFPTLRRKV